MKLSDNPVFRYGLRIFWRGWRLWIIPAIAFAATGILLIAAVVSPANRDMLTTLISQCTIGSMIVTLVMPAMAVLVMTREYDNRTFEALRLCAITSSEIATGKLACAVTPFLLAIAVTLPIAMATVFVGIADAGVVGAYYPHVACAVFVNTMAALYAGAKYRRVWPGMLVAYLLVLILVRIVWGLFTIPFVIVERVYLAHTVHSPSFGTLPGVSGPLTSVGGIVTGVGIAYLFWSALKSNLDRMPGEEDRPTPPPPGGLSRPDGIAQF